MSAHYDFTKPASRIAHSIIEKEAKEQQVLTNEQLAKARRKREKLMANGSLNEVLAPLTPIDTRASREIEEAVTRTTVAAAHTAPSKRELRPICGQIKKDGVSRCTGKCMEKDGVVQTYCTDHRPPIDHLSGDEQAALSQWVFDSPDAMAKIVSLLGWGVAQRMARSLMKGETL